VKETLENIHVLQKIVEAILLCVHQKNAIAMQTIEGVSEYK
jgi:hypothetical protein